METLRTFHNNRRRTCAAGLFTFKNEKGEEKMSYTMPPGWVIALFGISIGMLLAIGLEIVLKKYIGDGVK